MYAYAASTNRGKKLIKDGAFIIEHKPKFLEKKGGLLFHFGQIKYGFYIIQTAIKFKADYVLISSGTHWFLLWPLAILGFKILPTIHCLLWPKYKSRKVVNKGIDFLNGFF